MDKAIATKHLETFLKAIKPDRIESAEYQTVCSESGVVMDEMVVVTFTNGLKHPINVYGDSIAALTLDVLEKVIYT